MISRKTANILATNYCNEFACDSVYKEKLYDFLFDHDLSAWFCNATKKLYTSRSLKEFVMKLHTGETAYDATKDWTWEARRQLGQTYLEKLVTIIWAHPVAQYDMDYRIRKKKDDRAELKKRVELDGYKFVSGQEKGTQLI